MTPSDATRTEKFITRWQNSGGNERANYQMFFRELCDVLGVKPPDVKGSVVGDPYCFDKNITIYHPSGKKTTGFIDFYKAEHDRPCRTTKISQSPQRPTCSRA